MALERARLAQIEEVYEQGRYLDAYAELFALGDARSFTDAPALVLASRILNNLGAGGLARLLTIRAHRADRRDPEAAFYVANVLAEARGPWAALAFLRRFGDPTGASAETRALLMLQTCSQLAHLRDFEEADRLWRQAADLWQHPWLWVERSSVLAMADRWSEAKDAAQRALELGPRYRPALQQTASLLIHHDQRHEAEAVLANGAVGLQAPYLLVQLAHIRNELERPAEALRDLQSAVDMFRQPEAATVRGLASLAASIHFKLGDVERAIMFGRTEGSPAHLRLADRLERGLPARRVLLDVPWVRQDHKTCAPATLTSLCRFHGRQADHVGIVEAICYDGTPAASERRWAESQDLAARHFTVTWDAAVALIDRGLPFTLLTVEIGSSHLQAVVGYDLRRGSFLVRDPSTPVLVEMDAEAMLSRQAFAGPQGMVLVPRAGAAALDGLALPDAELHDGLYRLQLALLEHRRDDAERELNELRARAPASVVALSATRALASYDNNQAALLEVFDRILEAHPDAGQPRLARLSCLEGLTRAEHRRAQLAQAAERPDADPLFGCMWGEELAQDFTRADLADLWLRRALRQRPQDARAYAVLADMAGRLNDLTSAAALQRIASCLDDTNEGLAQHYSWLLRALGRAEDGLAFLRRRVDRLGKRAAGPWQTLHSALTQLDRVPEAQEVLAAAQAARPDDGDLLLMAAWQALRRGDQVEARRLAERAAGRVKGVAHARLGAELDRLAGDRESAMRRWREVLATDPLLVEAHAVLARLLAERGDEAAGLREVRAAAERNPHHVGLARLALDLTPDEGEEGLAPLQRLVALSPTDAWARRELALRLARRQRPAEALVEADRAVALDPESAATHGVRGFVLTAAGRAEEARQAFRAALTRAADYVAAFDGLLELAQDAADQLRALRHLQDEARRQVIFGDALRSFQDTARGLMPDDEILAFLEEARAARPDLRDCWATTVEQLVDMGRLDEARARAREAVARFPLLVEPLLQLARVEDRRGDEESRREALRRALAVEPAHPQATRALADALADADRTDEALALLDASVARSPLDPSNHGGRANLLARAGRIDEAFASLRRALELAPDYEWAWGALDRWQREHDAHARAVELATAITVARPDSGRAHLGRATVLNARAGFERQALAALDEALAREPRSVDALDQRALLLTELGQFEDAKAACRPASYGDQPPLALRGRRAWVMAQQRQLDEATEEMERVVADNPRYVWGWFNLGEWYSTQRQHAKARRAYSHALRVAPQDMSAALGLFDACLALHDHAGGAEALAPLARSDSPYVLARQVQLACRTGDRRGALATLERLTGLPQPSAWPLTEAARALAAVGRYRAALRVLERALAAPDRADAEALGSAWGAIADPIFIGPLRRLLAAGRAGQAAVATYLESLADRGHKRGILFALLWARGPLRRATRAWGAAGYALVTLGFHRLAARWFGDHAARDDARPWMLNNLVLALVRLGRDQQAHEVSARAVALPPDHTTDMHRRWLAFFEATAGREAEARRWLDAPLTPGGELGRLVEAYARALLGASAAEAADPERRRAAVEAVMAKDGTEGTPGRLYRMARRAARRSS